MGLRHILAYQADHGSDLDELVAVMAGGKLIKTQYDELKMSPPELFNTNMLAIEKEIRSRRRDNIERTLKEFKARKEALKTADEKRKDLDQGIADLEKQLAE